MANWFSHTLAPADRLAHIDLLMNEHIPKLCTAHKIIECVY